jgi:rare lipoprotein A (peptidoglycan hydrolase)
VFRSSASNVWHRRYVVTWTNRQCDLSPSTAKEIGIEHKNGVARVEVAPIVVPLGDGRVKLGAAAAENNIEASND